MSKNKREFDRHPGTGGSIKADAKRSGAGQGNWGDDKAVITEAVAAHKETTEKAAGDATATTTNPPPPKDDLAPENLGELAATEQKPQDVSYEEYVKQQSRSGVKAYDTRTIANSNFRADRYKGKNQFEKATDELLQGAQKEKKKRKKARKQQKSIKPEYSFHPASGAPDNRTGGGGAPRGRGRGRGRGGGGGDGGFNSERPYGGGGDRGYSRGYGGFGSRGRGRRNDENVDNDMPHQRPPPQYRLKNEGGGNEASAAQTQPHNESMTIPQPIV